MTLQVDYGEGRRLGLILPSGNTAAEPQFAAARPAGLALHWTRLPLNGSSDADLAAMAAGVEDGARLLRDARVDLVAFHCTAISTASGDAQVDVLRRIEAVARVPAIATSQALVAALHALGARRLVMLSPYVESIARREDRFFEHLGFEVLASRGLDIATPHEMLAVTPQRWEQLLLEMRHPEADAYVLSCTAIRGWEAVSAAERLLDRPVVTSNSAMLWYAARRLSVDVPLPACGRLGARPLPQQG
ncbi:hypothetical protein [Aquabacterium sp. J223]|uniref:maleate cis-trans isomerase family protein n=1 Tax=Aquabacterium sp. J223 TaxID=2898431 RepID=UPI0021ADCBF3|nr:hypothetical protein [Aquabacterium sp. J223]UUX95320.1 hypothetical protein LRS07_19240 [Aquabacterium sp. J223]